MLFKKYNKCIYCKSKNLIKEKNQYLKENFYLKAIKSDLKISKKKFNQIKVFRCQKCKIIQKLTTLKTPETETRTFSLLLFLLLREKVSLSLKVSFIFLLSFLFLFLYSSTPSIFKALRRCISIASLFILPNELRQPV